jgi:hypothetical protein
MPDNILTIRFQDEGGQGAAAPPAQGFSRRAVQSASDTPGASGAVNDPMARAARSLERQQAGALSQGQQLLSGAGLARAAGLAAPLAGLAMAGSLIHSQDQRIQRDISQHVGFSGAVASAAASEEIATLNREMRRAQQLGASEAEIIKNRTLKEDVKARAMGPFEKWWNERVAQHEAGMAVGWHLLGRGLEKIGMLEEHKKAIEADNTEGLIKEFLNMDIGGFNAGGALLDMINPANPAKGDPVWRLKRAGFFLDKF